MSVFHSSFSFNYNHSIMITASLNESHLLDSSNLEEIMHTDVLTPVMI